MSGKDIHSSYVDGIKVKISEKYKPPPRIILPVSYSQRLTMNDCLRRMMPQYDFSGEKSIKSSIVEWKIARDLEQKEQNSNFEACRKDIKSIDAQASVKIEKQLEKVQEAEQEEMKSTVIVASDYNIPSVTAEIQSTQHTILIPTIAGLNPQPHCSMLDKSPFNMSDFDPDTSSPFDNMALKSINDFEELALVLNKDKGTISGKMQHLLQSNQQVNQHQTSYQMYNYNEQQNALLTSYNNKNGYYQHSTGTIAQSPVNVNHSYSYPPGSYDQQQQRIIATLPNLQSSAADHRSTQHPSQSSQQQPLPSDTNHQCRTVPLIMRSIQQQLVSTHLHHRHNTFSTSPSASSHTGQTASTSRIDGSGVSIVETNHVEQLASPFGSLEASAQTICRGISSMGFPLARVARACALIGNDDKKIVEYLLVMSDLMDLGFSESSVSTALVKCNNDKDKALEELLAS